MAADGSSLYGVLQAKRSDDLRISRMDLISLGLRYRELHLKLNMRFFRLDLAPESNLNRPNVVSYRICSLLLLLHQLLRGINK